MFSCKYKQELNKEKAADRAAAFLYSVHFLCQVQVFPLAGPNPEPEEEEACVAVSQHAPDGGRKSQMQDTDT